MMNPISKTHYHIMDNVIPQIWDTKVIPIVRNSKFEYPHWIHGLEVQTELLVYSETMVDEIFEEIFDSGSLNGSAAIFICGTWLLSRRAIELVGLYYGYPSCCAKEFAWYDRTASDVWSEYGYNFLTNIGHVPCKLCCERLASPARI